MSTVDQSPAELAVTIVRGDDFSMGVALQDATPAAIDLTGWTLRAQVRARPNGPLLASWTFTNRNDAAGTFTMNLSAADTAKLPEACESDLETVDAGGVVRTYLRLTMTVEGDTTR